jgi:thymidylate synthase
MPPETKYNEINYLSLLADVLRHGKQRKDRTGVGTIGKFGTQTVYDLHDSFPLLTTKKVPFRHVAEELFWFLRGETNVKSLQEKGVHIWDEWADEDGELGPVYGYQWRKWERPNYAYPLDQIKDLIEGLKRNPDSRRHIVTAWNPSDVPDMALPPCHTMFQFYVQDDELDCQLYQRSGDLFLGVPFNIASYSLLTCLVAKTVGLNPGRFIHTIGDAHIYLNHVDQVQLQLSREVLVPPRLIVTNKKDNLWDYTMDDLQLVDYKPHPPIKAPVAV